MVPLIVMTAAWLVARAFGAITLWSAANSWGGALRFALATMFLFTAVSHFHRRTGAVGLLLPSTAVVAAYGLIALLILMLPANVHAARAGLMIAGRRATSLVWRLPLQVFWIGALWWAAYEAARPNR